jgi:hypothetical protein
MSRKHPLACNEKNVKSIKKFFISKNSDNVDDNFTMISGNPFWTCCICQTTMRENINLNNLHLNACLEKSESTPVLLPMKNSHTVDEEKISFNLIPFGEISYEYRLPGLFQILDFVSIDEEREIIKLLDEKSSKLWQTSTRNGLCESKTFGVITQYGGFKNENRSLRRNIPSNGEEDIPQELEKYSNRLHEMKRQIMDYVCEVVKNDHLRSKILSAIRSFIPNECNANNYIHSKSHHLTAHYDDRELSGPLLMNLSLLGHAKMTFSDEKGHEVTVDLPPRCLQLVTCEARYKWQHSIKYEDFYGDRRVSVTWRHAGSGSRKYGHL